MKFSLEYSDVGMLEEIRISGKGFSIAAITRNGRNEILFEGPQGVEFLTSPQDLEDALIDTGH